MIKGNIRIKTSISPGYLAQQTYKAGLYDAFVDELLDAADWLQQNSYTGVTKDLKGGWDVIAPRRETVTFKVNASIVNRSRRAINRVAGRGAGKPTPVPILEEWVKAKGIAQGNQALGIAIAISKTHAKKGSKRFREKENFMDINPDGSPKPNGKIEQIEETISKNLERKFK